MKAQIIESFSPIRKKIESHISTPNSVSHCLSQSLLKPADEKFSPIKPSNQLKTIGDKLYEMDDKERSIAVKQDKKIYKKSLEHYYFKTKNYPNKKAMASMTGRSKLMDGISPSASRIINKQIENQNWSAKKSADLGVLCSSVVASSNFPNSICLANDSDCSRFDLASSILDSSKKSSQKRVTLFG